MKSLFPPPYDLGKKSRIASDSNVILGVPSIGENKKHLKLSFIQVENYTSLNA